MLNTGARLDTLNKTIGTRICVSGEVVRKTRRHSFLPIGAFVVKGRREATEVFEPLHPRLRDVDLALTSYRRAVEELQSVRQDIPVEYRDGRSSYRITFGPVYLEYSDLLLRRASSDPAQATKLLREARDTIEELKGTELQDYFRDAYVTSFLAQRRSIETLAPGTAVIYPIALSDRLELLVSFGNELRQFTSPIPVTKLRDEVRGFRETSRLLVRCSRRGRRHGGL